MKSKIGHFPQKVKVSGQQGSLQKCSEDRKDESWTNKKLNKEHENSSVLKIKSAR